MLIAADAATLAALRARYHRATLHPVACPGCGAEASVPLLRGDGHGLDLETRLCIMCTLGFVSPRPSPDWFHELATTMHQPIAGSGLAELDDRFVRDQCEARATEIFDAVLAHLPARPRSYLDLGSGLGERLVEFRRRCPGASVHGVEPSSDAVGFCRERHGITVRQGELTTMAVAADFVTLVHVLQRALDPLAILQTAAASLTDEGCLYIEVPNLLSPQWRGLSFFEIAHPLYFTPDALTSLVRRAGLEPVATVHGASSRWPWAVGLVARRAHAPDVHAVSPVPRSELAAIVDQVTRQVIQREPR